MSQVSLLGFVSSRIPTQDTNAIHWSILISSDTSQSPLPQVRTTTRPKAKSFFSQRRTSWTSSKDLPSTNAVQSALFDMSDHQLRQQPYPVPIKNSAQTTTSIPTATSTSNQCLTLSLRVLLATSTTSPLNLTAKVSSLLYSTPTYGTDEDWLRAAISLLSLHNIFTPSASYDAAAILSFIGTSVQEYLALVEKGHRSEREVLDLDYARHVRDMESVRTLLRQDQSPSPLSSRSASSLNAGLGAKKQHKTFFGFMVSPSPSWNAGQRQREMWANAGDYDVYGQRRIGYHRRDDPYGGLM